MKMRIFPVSIPATSSKIYRPEEPEGQMDKEE
jgi:hypothetical protein